MRSAVLEAEVFFGDFEWNKRSNNPEKNSNTRYRSGPQLLLLLLLLLLLILLLLLSLLLSSSSLLLLLLFH